MREKFKEKGMLKKLVVIVLIVMLLQSYIYSFVYIAKAVDDIANSEVNNQLDNNQVVVGENSENVTDNTNTTTNSENTLAENQVEKPDENKVDTSNENDSVNNVMQEQNSQEESNQVQNSVGVSNQVQNQGEENSNTETNDNQTGNEPNNVTENGENGEEYIEPEVEVNVTSENTSIYKGYLYANATSNLRYSTNYNTIDEIKILKGSKNITTLTVQDEADKFGLITNIKVALLKDMSYKQSRIPVKEFNNLLGEEGIIKLYDENGELIGNISKETTVVNEEYVFVYPYQTNSVKFEINGIKSDGNITIKNDKYIKESSLFSRNQISLFSVINTIANVQVLANEQVKEYKAEGNINLEETESKMTLDVSQDTLSVEEQTEMTINVTLKADQERYDLFENPEITLEFPSAIENVEVTAINVLYKNALSLESWDILTNELGKKILKIKLSGSQLEYAPGSVQEGTTVVIYTKIDVNRLTADTNEALKLTYTNKDTIRKSYMLEGKDSEDVILNFVGRQEMVRASRVTLPNVGTEVSYDEQVEKIEISANNDEVQTVTLTGEIVNNFETETGNVVVIGRIPFVGNIDGNGNNLGSTFNTTLASSMATTGAIADVYYSEDGEAKLDDSSWTQDTSDLSKFKSYKIVVRNGKLTRGERLRFEYNVNIPVRRGYNEKTFGTYTVYYSLDDQMLFGNCTVGIFTEEGEVTTDDTENKEEVVTLEIGTQVSQNGRILSAEDTVYERQVLKYTVAVKNISNTTLNNILLKGRAVNANLYTWDYITRYNYNTFEEYTTKQMKEFTKEQKEYIEFNIAVLAPGESKTFEYEVITDSLDNIEEENPEVYGIVSLSEDNIEERNVETIKNKINKSEVEIRVEKNSTESLELDENLTNTGFSFGVYVKNISNEDLKDVSLDVYIPSSLDINLDNPLNIIANEAWKIESEKVGATTRISLKLSDFKKDFEDNIYFYTNIKPINYTIASQNFDIYAIANTKNGEYASNRFIRTAYQSESKLEYTWKSDTSKELLKDSDEVNFELNVKNVGYVDVDGLFIKSNFSSGLRVTKALLVSEGEESKLELFASKDNFEIYIQKSAVSIKPGKDITIKITAKIDDTLFKRDQSVVEALINVTHPEYGFNTDVISYKIENNNVTVDIKEEPSKPEEPGGNIDSGNIPDPSDPNRPDVPSEPQEPVEVPKKKTYYISGKAWLDKNKDGIKNNETGMEAIEVMLYKANSEGGADISNLIDTTITNSNGEYIFSQVEEGNYVVAFKYDTEIYNITKYQVATARDDENSDVVSKKFNIEGKSTILGMTDVLVVNNSSLINIDIGLVTRNDFDLALNKYLSKVVVKNKEGTKTYNFENGTNEKVEIRSKYFKNSTVDITYKIVIKNEGDVIGYVNKLVDYLPKDIKVDLSQNPGWYYGDDNNLYYNGLVEQEIEVGESKEIPLTVKVDLEKGNSLSIRNSAEIAEYTNALGLDDIDSVKFNKQTNEDDYGEALLLITVSTGKVAEYIIIILIIIIIVTSLVLLIMKKQNSKKIYK